MSKQSFPKCHPDIFDGEVTLFHPWKRSFKAMIHDADVGPAQEMNYLRNFTTAEVQDVVDNFRKSHHPDLSIVLKELWSELERRFGNTAAITNTLLERLSQKAKFNDGDLQGLQVFADLCGDVDSQMTYLPGLSCLNYPNVIRPIIERLPNFLRSKWEKEIITYAAKHQDAYPTFHVFASMVQQPARKKNHPNVQASGVQALSLEERRRTDQRRILATTSYQPLDPLPKGHSNEGKKHCLYHDRDGHTLIECKVFKSKSLDEKTDWIRKASLCFLCLSKDHRAKECESKTTCEICGDNRHIALLHKDKPKEQPNKEISSEATDSVSNRCTTACDNSKGGLSCRKIVLVDVFAKTATANSHRVYAIIDDQSNASLISNELADILGASGPEERYLLSTCHGSNEERYGRRVSGIVARSSLGGEESSLPILVECEHIPSDKREIPTPEMARRFTHLREIADEIPPIDPNADIHILLGRDAPEILKVRAFKNGPKGDPLAQKLSLGWTVSGQTCLDLVNKQIHINARRTKIENDVDERSKKPETYNQEAPPVPTDGE